MATKKLKWAELLASERQHGTTVYPAIYEAEVKKFLENVNRIDDNRNQTKLHINTLTSSVTELGGLLRDIVVVEYDNKCCIADGEHLKYVLSNLNLPVRFKFFMVNNLREAVNVMRQMNSSSKNWSLNNFINACKSLSIDYAKLYDLTTDTSINVTSKMMAGIMYSTNRFLPSKAIDMVKRGTFQVNINNAELNRRIDIIKRFYRKTNMKECQNCVWGLMDLILEKSDYSKKESKFLELVKKVSLTRKYTTFGANGEFYNFFIECWNSI